MMLGADVAQGATPVAKWAAAWAAPHSDAFWSVSVHNETIRQIVTLHQGGQAIRLRLSNRFGKKPVTLDDVRVGLSERDAAVLTGSSRQLTFAGKPVVTLAPGASALSDPVSLDVVGMQRLAVSLYAAGKFSSLSRHIKANEYLWRAKGNQAQQESGAGFERIDRPLDNSWLLIDEVDVLPRVPTRVVVAFGDSLTDGFFPITGAWGKAKGVAVGEDQRFPDFLARRLIAADLPVSVVGAAMCGNRLLSDALVPVLGPAGLSRLSQDVLKVAGATDVLMLIGINDLGSAWTPRADELINGMKKAIGQFRQAGLRVILGTLMPAKGTSTGSFYRTLGDRDIGFLHGRACVDRVRNEINSWIRHGGAADGVVDFDACMRDPLALAYLRADYDSGDHLHPNAEGYAAMAACVDLSLFQ